MREIDIENHAVIVNHKIKHIKKDWGIFFTPQWVVDFMVDLIDEERLNINNLKILEPACGICQFLIGIKKNKNHIFEHAIAKIGVEINKEVIKYAEQHIFTGDEDINIIHNDYLLWNSKDHFDVIIGNPPYGIPSLSEHYTIRVDNEIKNQYKKMYETWYGKYNVYGAFIEKSIKLLKDNGQLIFIVPATFMILDEFKKLRSFLATQGKAEIIYMGNEVFKPEADVTTVILKFVKTKSEKGKIILYDYNSANLRLITENDDWKGEVVLFSTVFSRKVDKICSYRVGDIYTIRISPRTPEIKHNPEIIKAKDIPDKENLLPILNGRNLKIGRVDYKPITGYWIDKNKKTKLRKFFDKPHIVVGLGFRGDGQVGAAYDYKAYPWMGDVYHLLRKHTLINMQFDLTDEEVVGFLNSEIIKKYVKDVFRDITYHFNITQLKMLPLPTKEELIKLKEVLS
ncbi:Eco57I restriction-modification methylase domain-containing protein [Desulfurobacterium atlanticum]|uniref:site-specific DNA-methyltransferase (adenine-specific) n=1 Tax=Desulfurobacterium atlanticum TaxID=240169 RepID=A0A238ZJQ5_9BACT|nr:TaqI-like C-terminal specificity domain-containing protein [Desulfurobacterium atlanticum]SNR83645.1 adenine-specific DNA-methyltransferase [Desulfurobacterium atlanticum]